MVMPVHELASPSMRSKIVSMPSSATKLAERLTDSVQHRPSPRLPGLDLRDDLAAGAASHLDKSKTSRNPTEDVALAVDLHVLQLDARAFAAGSVDGRRLLVARDGEQSACVEGGVAFVRGFGQSRAREEREEEKPTTHPSWRALDSAR